MLTAVLPDQYGNVVLDAVPFAPPLSNPAVQVKPGKLAVVAMLLPDVPGAFAVSVIPPPVDAAVTPVVAFSSVVLALIADTIFEASCVALTAVQLVVPLSYANVVAAVAPHPPPLSVPPPHAKPVKLDVVVMLFPPVPVARAVTLTTAPLPVALTSVFSVVFAVIVAAIFVANCVVLTAALPDQYGNVVADAVPSKPPVRVV